MKLKFPRRASLHWSKKAENYPNVGQVWSTHRDERMWLVLMDGRIGWTSWAFEVMDLETGEVEVISVSEKWNQKRWTRHS